MKKLILIVLLGVSFNAFSQGISVSYLFPKNGYLSAPVSPISLRGIGFGETFGLQTGFTLYNIPGLAMDELPFDYEQPLLGPHFALLVPVEGFVSFPIGSVTLSINAGGFGWWNINPRLKEGNMDRAFREYEGWDVLNTDFDFKTRLGYGWLAGLEVEIPVVSNVYLTLGGRYMQGGSKTELEGTYAGGNEGDAIETKTFETDDARTVLDGFELSIGVQIGE